MSLKPTLTAIFNSVGNKGVGEQVREINLKEYDKALIGFRGWIKEKLFDFYIYVAQRLDVLYDVADDDPQILEMEAEVDAEAENLDDADN